MKVGIHGETYNPTPGRYIQGGERACSESALQRVRRTCTPNYPPPFGSKAPIQTRFHGCRPGMLYDMIEPDKSAGYLILKGE